MSFSLIEGQVETRPVVVESVATATVAPNSPILFILDFVLQAQVTHFGIKAQSGAFPFSVNIYSKNTKEFSSLVISASSEGESTINFHGFKIPAISPAGKLYFEITHSQTGNESFDIVVHAETMRSIQPI